MQRVRGTGSKPTKPARPPRCCSCENTVRRCFAKLAAETGKLFNQAGGGEYVAGTYRQRLTLASGRFAMLDDGLGFQLVPWTPALEKHLGRHVSGVARTDGGIDWSFARKRGLGL